MDTLFWKNLSPDIQIEHTSKKFFKQYLYKLEVHAPGCKSIREYDIGKHIDTRKLYARSYGTGSWWDRRLKEVLETADVKFLYVIQDIINRFPDAKIRTEEPKINFYCDSDAMLEAIALAISSEYKHNIISVTVPENDIARELLTSNKILVKKKPEYQYRVWFREKQFSQESRQQVYQYLSNLGDLIKMSPTTANHLVKPGDWIWGSYFYTKDPGVAEFIRLINPDMIREVCELVCAE